jgi:hypothetical protein
MAYHIIPIHLLHALVKPRIQQEFRPNLQGRESNPRKISSLVALGSAAQAVPSPGSNRRAGAYSPFFPSGNEAPISSGLRLILCAPSRLRRASEPRLWEAPANTATGCRGQGRNQFANSMQFYRPDFLPRKTLAPGGTGHARSDGGFTVAAQRRKTRRCGRRRASSAW